MARFALLSFLLVSVAISPGSGKACKNPYPGLVRMARGVDITSLDLFPTNLLNDNGFGRTLFEFTCRTKNTWSHPENSDLSFEVPDQIAGLNSLPSGAFLVRTDFEQSMKQFKNWLAVNVGLDISAGLFGSFSASASYKESQMQIMRSNKSLAETSATITTTQVDFKFGDQMVLSPDFLDYIQNHLPSTYEEGPLEYNSLIESYGTHYFETAQFGGFLYQKTLIDNDYLSNTDEQEISVNVEANFKQKVGLTTNVDKGKTDVQENMKSKSCSHFYYYGGETDLINEKEFLKKWQPTIYKKPWLLSGKLKPIEDLIKDVNIRTQVIKAVNVKRAKAYLADLKNAISLGQIRLSTKDRKEIETIERILKDPKTSVAELQRYGSDGIDALFERVQVIRALSQIRYAYEKALTIRDLRNCLMTATMYCERSLFLSIARKGEAWKSIHDRLHEAFNGSKGLNSEQMFHLVQEAGRFFYSIEYMELNVPKANYQCVRNMVNRSSECKEIHQQRGHKFTINPV